MTKEACQQDKTPFDLSNDFGPLRQPRTWERKKSKNVGTCVRNLRWKKNILVVTKNISVWSCDD